MIISKRIIKISALSSLVALFVVGISGVAFAKATSPGHSATESNKSNVNQAVLSEAIQPETVASNNSESSTQNNTASSQVVGGSTSLPTSSSINNENGHETSNPPNDELVEIQPESEGTLIGTVTTTQSGSSIGFPSGFVSVPFQATILVKDMNNKVIKSAHSGPDGKFQITLDAGTYILEPQFAGDFYYTPSAQQVTISANDHPALVSFEYVPMGTTNSLSF